MTEHEKSVETYAFESPLNIEGSWGGRNITNKALSTMELWLYKDGCSGMIEWIATVPPAPKEHPDDEEDEGEEFVEHIGLTFEVDPQGRRTLVDYDGVFTLPTQAMDLLEKWNVDCREMRKTLKDDDDEPDEEGAEGTRPAPSAEEKND